MKPLFFFSFPITLGTAPFGTSITRETAFSILDAFLDRGGQVIDTAAVYGMGISERTVGDWLRARGTRSRVMISTKGGHPSLPDWSKRITEKDIRLDMESSLRNLDTDCVDVYFLHRDDEGKPVAEIMPILDALVREGKTRLIGASNWTVSRINEANRFAHENGLSEFSVSQIFWNGAVINREGVHDQTLVAMDSKEHGGYAENRMPVMAYTAQAQGLFSHIRDHGIEALREDLKRMYLNPCTLERAKRVLRVAAETGVSPTAVSLAYLLHDEAVTAYPILGISRVERLEEALRVFDLTYDAVELLFR